MPKQKRKTVSLHKKSRQVNPTFREKKQREKQNKNNTCTPDSFLVFRHEFAGHSHSIYVELKFNAKTCVVITSSRHINDCVISQSRFRHTFPVFHSWGKMNSPWTHLSARLLHRRENGDGSNGKRQNLSFPTSIPNDWRVPKSTCRGVLGITNLHSPHKSSQLCGIDPEIEFR